MITKEQYLRIHELSKLGVSGRKIAPGFGISHKSVQSYLAMSEEEFDRKLDGFVKSRKGYDTYRTGIIEILTKYPESKPSAIRNRLQVMYDDFSIESNDNAFYQYIRKIREETGILLPERPGTKKYNIHHSLRETPDPGYESEVDFGEKVMKDMYGKNRRIYIFTMVLTFSNLLFGFCSPEPFTTASAIEAHRKAFEFFGGRTKTILYDNDVVFTQNHNYGDPILTSEFEKFIDEIGFGVRFCKPRQPGSKGNVEVGVGTIKNFLSSRTYAGIDSLNSELLEWLDRYGNAHESQGKGVSAHELFEEEASALIKVPKYMKVQTIFAACADNVVRYKHNMYELPMYKAPMGTRIKVIDEGNTIAFLMADTEEFLCRHTACKEQGRRIPLPDKDATAGRSSVESLLIRYRGNDLMEQFVVKGKELNPRYFVSLCQRVLRSQKLIPEDIIFDAVKHMIAHEACTLQEYMGYLEYRGLGHLNYQFGDKMRVRYLKVAEKIAEEYKG